MERATKLATKDCQLELLKDNLRLKNYPGYPEASKRFVSELHLLGRTALGRLIIPDGPWTVDTHPNRHDNEIVPSTEEQQRLLACGLELDERGRPLHPWLRDMIADPAIGIVTGKGMYWQWGPNHTADPVIIRRDLREPHVLLITRRDTGLWALPGGFVDKDEDPLTAAIREAQEEAGIDLASLSPRFTEVYWGPVADLRATANAWPHTTAYSFELTDEVASQLPQLEYAGGDDALRAKWTSVSDINSTLFGSHKLLIQLALRPVENKLTKNVLLGE